jgi:hypothetical protein
VGVKGGGGGIGREEGAANGEVDGGGVFRGEGGEDEVSWAFLLTVKQDTVKSCNRI